MVLSITVFSIAAMDHFIKMVAKNGLFMKVEHLQQILETLLKSKFLEDMSTIMVLLVGMTELGRVMPQVYI